MIAEEAVLKFLDVSTVHITEATSALVESMVSSTDSPLWVLPYFDTGWIIRVPDMDEDEVITFLASRALLGNNDLSRILRAADELGCSYVQLHEDGFVIDGLQTYER